MHGQVNERCGSNLLSKGEKEKKMKLKEKKEKKSVFNLMATVRSYLKWKNIALIAYFGFTTR